MTTIASRIVDMSTTASAALCKAESIDAPHQSARSCCAFWRPILLSFCPAGCGSAWSRWTTLTLDLEASTREDSKRSRIPVYISAQAHSGHGSKPQTQGSTSRCAPILFAADNRACCFSGLTMQPAITNPANPIAGPGLRLSGRVDERSSSAAGTESNRICNGHRRWCPTSQPPCATSFT